MRFFVCPQLVVQLVKNESLVVRAIEEICLLTAEWQVARNYCQRRVDTISRRIEVLSAYVHQHEDLADPIRCPEGCFVSPRADLYFLQGSDVRSGELARWQKILNDIDELSSGAFNPHGRMYYATEVAVDA